MKKYPFIKQNGINDCGPACLEMIIEYYGGYVGIDRVGEMTNTSKDGTSAYYIKKVAIDLGFNSYATNHIKTFPCIALVKLEENYNHYIVLYKKINDYYLVADPADSIKKISCTYFNEISMNVIINFVKEKEIIKLKENKIYTYYLAIIKKYKSLFLLIVVFSILFLILSFIYVYFYKLIVTNKSFTFNIIYSFILVNLFKYIVLYIKNVLTIKLEKIINFDLIKDVINKLIKLPYSYYKNHTAGEIINRFNEIPIIKNSVIELIVFLFLEFPLFIFILMFMLVINYKLLIIVLIILLIYLLINKLYNKKLLYRINLLNNTKDLSNSFFTESLFCFDYVKGANIENKIIKDNIINQEKYIGELNKYNMIYNRKILIEKLVISFGEVMIIMLGIKNLDISNFIVYLYLYSYVIEIADNFINFDSLYREAKNSYKRIYELDVMYNYGTIESIGNYDIDIRNLKFNYGLNDVITNFDLNIKKGTKVLIFGKSGCGKSTLLKIIKGYYKSDCVYLDNLLIKDYKKDVLDKIIYIGQSDYLFSETLYNNLMCDDRKRIEEYATLLFVDRIYENKPEGINMMIRENGFNLSQGQRQQIVLLRNILKDFEILLIDEGLCSMDNILERDILINMFKEFKNKTIIVVSHKMKNMDLYDKVICFDNYNKSARKVDGYDK